MKLKQKVKINILLSTLWAVVDRPAKANAISFWQILFQTEIVAFSPKIQSFWHSSRQGKRGFLLNIHHLLLNLFRKLKRKYLYKRGNKTFIIDVLPHIFSKKCNDPKADPILPFTTLSLPASIYPSISRYNDERNLPKWYIYHYIRKYICTIRKLSLFRIPPKSSFKVH